MFRAPPAVRAGAQGQLELLEELLDDVDELDELAVLDEPLSLFLLELEESDDALLSEDLLSEDLLSDDELTVELEPESPEARLSVR